MTADATTMDAFLLHRLQFAFTVIYHYLFPQLTMGLALIVVLLMGAQWKHPGAGFGRAARFWRRILAISFVFGVVTGIPMEFQFGTNWSRFSAAVGATLGQTLAMEGVFAFFLESSFLYILLYGEGRVGVALHRLSAVLLLLGTWASAFFIICANAWMQHPAGLVQMGDGTLGIDSLWSLLGNSWAWSQWIHAIVGSVITASFVVAGTGAFYALRGEHTRFAQISTRFGVLLGLLASLAAAFPTGDWEARKVLEHQPTTFAAFEGLFQSEDGADLVLIGQPNVEEHRLDNPLPLPFILSLMAYQQWDARVRGLDEFPEEDWPDNIPLLYYAYHIMAGLGTLFILLMLWAGLLLVRGKLLRSPPILWGLVLFIPLPFVANTMGWMTTELGRQPWLIYGFLRTEDGYSTSVSEGNVLMTFLGFAGVYTLITILVALLTARVVGEGPDPREPHRLHTGEDH